MYPAPACRTRKIHSSAVRFSVTAALVLAALLFLVKNLFVADVSSLYNDILGAVPGGIVSRCQKDPLKILKTAMPMLDWGTFEGDKAGRTFGQALLDLAGSAARVSLRGPAAILQSQVPLLAAAEPSPAVPAVRPVGPGGADAGSGTVPPAGGALVIIYNTHTGETYGLTDGVERLDGRRGGVVTAAAALKEALESRYGIRVVASERIHDRDYDNSYAESEKTVRELLAANPGARAVLDIHRDSGKTRAQSVVEINGRKAAPILFVVGSGNSRTFPGWRQNYNFAVQLSGKINEMYPGLSLGVRVKDGFYNQFLHPHAVLVEIGTAENSTEEAVRSAEFMADALAAVIAGVNPAPPAVPER
ncbi:hypothetical membrane protein [Pelotomaculum thermopropionicum SI]|uniref:Hypothetical membrane protein n=1 Tax=Pelotomaculum thermopropionicum (strain DSM 13744 / JCM 10971 / SI) TaxID=370438 RepID=A5D3X4_PELTS|nr:hypothetical membrane protein [Pelotomaculum thermopropionicum SI]